MISYPLTFNFECDSLMMTDSGDPYCIITKNSSIISLDPKNNFAMKAIYFCPAPISEYCFSEQRRDSFVFSCLGTNKRNYYIFNTTLNTCQPPIEINNTSFSITYDIGPSTFFYLNYTNNASSLMKYDFNKGGFEMIKDFN